MALTEGDAEGQARLRAIREGLEKFGWSDGQNVQIDARWAAGSIDQLRSTVTELVRQKPDVIVVSGTSLLQELKPQTKSIPIVFFNVADPVGDGLVASLVSPGGNVTGFSNFEDAITGKWIGLLRELAGDVTRVLVIYYSENIAASGQLRALQAAAPSFGAELTVAGIRDEGQFQKAIDSFAQGGRGCMIMLPDAHLGAIRDRIISSAQTHRIPAIYPLRYFAVSGGLISYGADTYDLARRTAAYVDRILRGENPADLPIQTPTKFELVINLKTAKALGLSIPQALLATADEVIE
jgi:putative ABC transport system substrate-binding protein